MTTGMRKAARRSAGSKESAQGVVQNGSNDKASTKHAINYQRCKASQWSTSTAPIPHLWAILGRRRTGQTGRRVGGEQSQRRGANHTRGGRRSSRYPSTKLPCSADPLLIYLTNISLSISTGLYFTASKSHQEWAKSPDPPLGVGDHLVGGKMHRCSLHRQAYWPARCGGKCREDRVKGWKDRVGEGADMGTAKERPLTEGSLNFQRMFFVGVSPNWVSQRTNQTVVLVKFGSVPPVPRKMGPLSSRIIAGGRVQGLGLGTGRGDWASTPGRLEPECACHALGPVGGQYSGHSNCVLRGRHAANSAKTQRNEMVFRQRAPRRPSGGRCDASRILDAISALLNQLEGNPTRDAPKSTKLVDCFAMLLCSRSVRARPARPTSNRWDVRSGTTLLRLAL
ncbi:hypothetical protein BDK51DRAFT_37160 [Blyttiomyces helicus]|uniref:Uncharacterized protein n=1 Tax=Blyttiomyces helicus TaxID=388810 RepID=A0A4P9WEK4_9FUNG|nr:hypothetical protein BDK51DRAFT_37160 [Blyttiomyces helicus]|eukprot:RKO88826.1 hypothetical protein BDK51DRAFT_37160 [Blyttiomyces helicus]